MIAKASSISHGYAAINYAVTKDDAVLLRLNKIDVSATLGTEGLASAIWGRMRKTERDNDHPGRKLKRDAIRIELAPSIEQTATLKTKRDWEKLLDDWIDEMEKPFVPKGEKRKNTDTRLNIRGSKYVAAIHYDSGKPHIHLVVNRVDDEGHTNFARQIGRRASEAANRVNAKRGWVQSQTIHDNHAEEIAKTAMEVLAEMETFSWQAYAEGMSKHGYSLRIRRDKDGKVVNYGFSQGRARYKSSEVGKGKHLTAAHIFTTWLKLHPEAQYNNQQGVEIRHFGEASITPKLDTFATSENSHNGREQQRDNITPWPVSTPSANTKEYVEVANKHNEKYPWRVPKAAYDTMEEEAFKYHKENDLPTGNIRDDIMPRAAEIFCNAKDHGSLTMAIIEAATDTTSIVGGGGVQGELTRWDGTTDDDDALARRAGRAACHHSRGKRSGRGGRRR